MTNDGLNALTYDAENRFVTSTGSTYSFDGNGLRVKKISGATTTVYIFSGGQVIAEYLNGAAPASPAREYVYSGAQLLATFEGGATEYHHADHLSVRLTTDATGAILGQQGHFPFGESWYASGTTTKWIFTNYEHDTESGNDYAVGRTYINRFGRFSSPDPLEAPTNKNPQSQNRYAYVVDDPVNRTDPDGLSFGVDWLNLSGVNSSGDPFSSGGAELIFRPSAFGGAGGGAGYGHAECSQKCDRDYYIELAGCLLAIPEGGVPGLICLAGITAVWINCQHDCDLQYPQH